MRYKVARFYGSWCINNCLRDDSILLYQRHHHTQHRKKDTYFVFLSMMIWHNHAFTEMC